MDDFFLVITNFIFQVPLEKMKPSILPSIIERCNEFAVLHSSDEDIINDDDDTKYFHDKKWKEPESKLLEIVDEILYTL